MKAPVQVWSSIPGIGHDIVTRGSVMAEMTADGAVTLVGANRQSRPDVVLADRMLSGSDGLAFRNVRLHIAGALTLLDYSSFGIMDSEIFLAPTPDGEFLIAGNSTFRIANSRLTPGIHPMVWRYREAAQVDITGMHMIETTAATLRHDVADRVSFRTSQSQAA